MKNLGLSEKEKKDFWIIRHIQSLITTRKGMGDYEMELSNAEAARVGRKPQGIFIPTDILADKRDLTVGTDAAGGYTVGTDLLAGSFIDFLYNRMMVNQLGATIIPDLRGDVAIPRETGGPTSYWLAESGAPTESQPSFDQVSMSPKTVGAYTDISRNLVLQSSIFVETLVRRLLATSLALAIDIAAINGTGSNNQPTGILNTAGIGSVVGGANGLAPTWSHVVDLESEIANDNADAGQLAYLTNSKVRGKLKVTEKASSTGQFVWEHDPRMRAGFGVLNGNQAAVSNQVPWDLDKGTSTGVCSAIIFGNWNDLFIGLWGGLDILVDQYTHSSTGTIRIVALQSIDIALRHAKSFAAMKDALTA